MKHSGEIMSDDLVEVASFRDYIGAHVAKSKLESEGIRSFLFNERLVTWNWFYSNALGGVKVMVGDSEANEALSILSAKPKQYEGTEEESFSHQTPTCPVCSCSSSYEDKFARRFFFFLALLWYSLGFIASEFFDLWLAVVIFYGMAPILYLMYWSYRRLNPIRICVNCGKTWKMSQSSANA